MKMLLLLLSLPIFFFLASRPAVQSWVFAHLAELRKVGKVLCVVVLGTTIAGGLLGALTERTVLHDEAAILSIAAAYHHAQPLYPSSSAPAEYALLYGPAAFLVYLPPMYLGFERLGAFQVWVVLALAATFGLVFLTIEKVLATKWERIGLLTLLAISISPFITAAWSTKGDIWILFFSALGIWATTIRSRWVAAIVISAAGAMLMNIKFPLLFLALVPCLLLWQRERPARMPALLGAFLIPLLALLTFRIPGISLSGYSEELREASRHGMSLHVFLGNLPSFFFLALPTFFLALADLSREKLATRAWVKRRAPLLGLIAIVFAVGMVSGAKHGGGPWHSMVVIIPLMVVDAELLAIGLQQRDYRTTSAPSYAFPALALITSLFFIAFCSLGNGLQLRFHDSYRFVPAPMFAIQSDILQVIQHHPGQTVAMGYSDTKHYDYTFARPILQMRGMPLFIDGVARNEADLAGVPMPAAVYKAVDHCNVGIWLIPKGGDPFSQPSFYYLNHDTKTKDLYPETFREDFLKAYKPVPDTSKFFDLWECAK